MIPSAHVVDRLTLDIDVDDLDIAMRLRARAEDMARALIPATLARLLDDMVPADLHLRMDRIDLDLGAIAPDRLEADLPDALAHALRESLADILAAHAARSGGATIAPDDRLLSPTAATLQDLDGWLGHGSPHRPGAARFDPAAAMAHAIGEAPDRLIALLRRHAHDRRALERLVIQTGEEGLVALLGTLAPAEAATILAWLAEIGLLHRRTPALGSTAPVLRRSLWLLTFDYLLRDAGSPFNRRSFVAFLLRGIAAEHGMAMAALLDLLRATLAPARRRRPLAGSLPGILDALASEPGHAPAAARAAPADAFALAAGGDMIPLLALMRDAARDPAALAALVTRLSPALFAAAVAKLEPDHADVILAYVAGLASLHRDAPIVPQSRAALTRMLRVLVLHYLLRDAGTAFNRRHWLLRLLRGLAAASGIAYSFLLATLAEALERLRQRVPPSGSLPAAIAMLVADLPAPNRTLPSRLGESVLALAKTLAGRHADPAAVAQMLAGLESADAAAIRAGIADLIRLHRRMRLAPLSDAAFVARLRQAAITALPGFDAPFDLRAWLRRLLTALTTSGPVSAFMHTLIDMSPHLLHTLALADDAGLAAALSQAGFVANAALEADLEMLARRHARRPFLAIDAAGFRRLSAMLAAAALATRPSFDRRTVRKALLACLSGPGETADWAELAKLPAGAENDLAFAEAVLRGGQPAGSGLRLPAIAAADPTGFVALLRRLAVAASANHHQLVARLLDWLTPEEAAALLWPDEVAMAVQWAGALAADSGSLGAAWTELLARALRGERPDIAIPPAPGRRLDERALLQDWLDSGELPWWAPRGTRIESLLAKLPGFSDAALTAFFSDPDPDRSLVRLRRARGHLGIEAGTALLRRLAPGPFAETGPLHLQNSSLAPDARVDIELRAVAAALAGQSIEPAALRRPSPPMPASPGAPPPSVADTRESDDSALFAWLAGEGPARPATLARMVRRIAERADQADPELDGLLRRSAGNAAARARWSTLSDELFGRLLHRLAPAQAPYLIDLIAILARAWRRRGASGGSDPVTALRLAAIALLSAPPSLRAIADRLIGALAPEPEMAAALRGEAAALARAGGEAHLHAVLRPPTAQISPPPPATPSEIVEPRSGDSFYVANAGLVLFNPFLPRFFDQLGVLSGDPAMPRITGIDAASRAVHLLQYLVDEQCDRPEPALVLNKLLCGLPMATPVTREIVADDDDRRICAGMIAAVIGNWSMIANTSPAGLRETFLQRDGRLRRDDGRWTLEVERKTVDILTDQIPWNRAILFHKWMTEPLHVLW